MKELNRFGFTVHMEPPGKGTYIVWLERDGFVYTHLTGRTLKEKLQRAVSLYCLPP